MAGWAAKAPPAKFYFICDSPAVHPRNVMFPTRRAASHAKIIVMRAL
jgi:hypothetical protein